jgi:NitT/TauT family transport system permease protein
MRRAATILVFFAGLVAIWWLASASGRWSPVMMPSPFTIADYLWSGVKDGSIFDATWVTMQRLIVGYVIGVGIGLPVGLLMSAHQGINDTVGSIALGFQTLPSVCWVPLALIWFGQSEGAMLFVVIMGSVWSVMIATSHGARNIPPIYARAARTMGSEGFHRWTHVVIPASLPFLVTGMKQGWAFAWRSLMAAEIYVTVLSGFGLGHLLHYGRELNAMDQVIGVMIVIVAIGLIADRILFSPWEHFLHERWGTGQA